MLRVYVQCVRATPVSSVCEVGVRAERECVTSPVYLSVGMGMGTCAVGVCGNHRARAPSCCRSECCCVDLCYVYSRVRSLNRLGLIGVKCGVCRDR
eukprot:scaffold72383_cov44-Phaeocystis_antarctica.AAC.1